MPILHAIVLGITQGLSEFLPISSSGHLILVPWLFGWDDFAGNASLEKTFDVALHLGTLVGAVAYFRKDIVRYLRGRVHRRRAAAPTTAGSPGCSWLSAVPAAVTGALFADVIEEHTGSIPLIAIDAHRVRPRAGLGRQPAGHAARSRSVAPPRRAADGRRPGARPAARRVPLRGDDDGRAAGAGSAATARPASRS